MTCLRQPLSLSLSLPIYTIALVTRPLLQDNVNETNTQLFQAPRNHAFNFLIGPNHKRDDDDSMIICQCPMDENQTQTQAQEPGSYSAQTGADLRSKHSCVRTLLRGPLTALDSTCSSGFSVRMEFSAGCGRLSPLGRERRSQWARSERAQRTNRENWP